MTIEPHRDEPPGPSLVVTLVHGTFAPDAPWTEPGSELCRELRDALGSGVVLERFRWSGKNTHGARQAAATELRALLSRQADQYPDARLCIVAHSHGGNVALYALRDERVGARVQGVVCLATPFICTEPRDFLSAWDTLLQTAGLTLVVMPILGMMSGFYLLTRGAGEIASWLIWGSVGTLIGLAILGQLAPGWVAGLVARPIRWINQRLQQGQQAITETLGVPSSRRYPLYCAVVRGDEARRGLGVVDYVSGVPFAMFERMGALVSATADFTEGASRVGTQLNYATRPLRAFGGEGGGIAAALAVVAAVVVAAIVVPATAVIVMLMAVLLLCAYAPSVRRVGYWGEEFRAGVLAEVSVRPRPLGSAEWVVSKEYDVRATARANPVWRVAGRLSHCNVYEDRAVIGDVVAWIASGCPPPARPRLEKAARRTRRVEDSGLAELFLGILVAVAVAVALVVVSV